MLKSFVLVTLISFNLIFLVTVAAFAGITSAILVRADGRVFYLASTDSLSILGAMTGRLKCINNGKEIPLPANINALVSDFCPS